MSAFDRFLFALYAIFITALFVLFALVMVGWTVPVHFLREAVNPARPEIFWPLLAIMVLIGLRLLWVSLRRNKTKKSSYVVLREGALGEVNLSLQAIENLVEKVVTQMSGVKEVKPSVMTVPDGIGININVAVTPDVNMPQLTEEMQNKVKSRMYEVTGLTINTIKVVIENISVHKPRVE
ncbi:MAG: alkaline shock response membrane anchor protein AmaP [Peptococcaceae bacterium]|nr:alkaline shock response membrane anchor protein AmaP [Peptococcaceae bacterium]